MIFTFYSYKGGVGRSLALAHVAYAFAERGLRVLAIDFDLEAPGLERYCFAGNESVATAREHAGLIDLIMAYRRALTSTAAFEAREFRDWKQFVMTVRDPVNAQGGRLDLMTAGRRASPQQLRDYSLTIRTFDWLDFFHNWRGDAFFKWLRDEWTRDDTGYDVVLVDSRTGVTEMGGVCAYQLADVAVLMCAPNDQNLYGTLDVMRDFDSPGVLGLRGGRPLRLLAVPTRLELQHPMRDTFLKRFAEVLGPPTLGPDVPVSYADLALPYLPSFAIAEAVIGGPSEKASDVEREAFATFTASSRKLADALTLLSSPASRLGMQSTEALATLRGAARAETVPLEADSSRRSAGYDFFIDCGNEDGEAAMGLAELLRERNLEVFMDLDSNRIARAWASEIELALDYSACVLVCFGKVSTSGSRTQLLKRVRGSLRPAVLVPVLLPQGSETAPHSFGLEDFQVLDLRDGVDAQSIEPLIAARRRASSESTGRDTAVHRNPYPGALPYGEDDARFLFGRDDEIRHLLDILESEAVVWVDGPAKVGKTSFVLAGVLPALRARAGASETKVRILVHDASIGLAWPQWSEPEAGDDTKTGRYHHEVIVLDHCDDFNAAPTDESCLQRDSAVQRLFAGCSAHRRLLIVARSPELADAFAAAHGNDKGVKVGRFSVRRLEGAAWHLAITEPAKRAGHLLENGLFQRVTESVGSAHAAMFQAQLALQGLWGSRRDGWLTNRGLDGLGHLAGVFKRHLHARLAALDEADRQAAAVLFQALCQVDSKSGIPLAVSLPWLEARTPAVLAAAGAERLRDRLAADGLIDIWCDATGSSAAAGLQVALTRSDARSYFDDAWWVAEGDFMAWRARLAPALLHWRQGGAQPSALLPDTALAEAALWHRLRRGVLTGAELDFVETSFDAQRLRSPSLESTNTAPTDRATSGALLEDGDSPLQVTVLNGDLRFLKAPLMVGHYRSLALTGSEAAIDRVLRGEMSKALHGGLYPDEPGTARVFDYDANWDKPLAKAAPSAIIVVGLGDEGRLRSKDLVASVCKAILSFMARWPLYEGRGMTLSTTLMGSGSSGVSTSSCAQLIVQGVQEANRKLRASGDAVIEHLQFVERFHDRASEAWRALRQQSLSQPRATVLGFGVAAGIGALRRALASGYRGAAYDVISVSSVSHGDATTIVFQVDSSSARSEVRAQTTQVNLARELVRKASQSGRKDPQLGSTLFQLLIPLEVEPFLSGTRRILLELDAQTAPIPWELLNTQADGQPWAIRTQMLRKLRKENFRQVVRDASPDDSVLVVGEPLMTGDSYSPLPGAKREAQAVARVLLESGMLAPGRINALLDSPSALEVINALFERRYRIVHIAGHGEPGQRSYEDPNKIVHKGGVVLSDGAFLGSDEIRSMRTVPDLVFVNCCHLVNTDDQQALNEKWPAPPDRAAFAYGLADALMETGVRCVVAAGWAVDDEPAEVFATTFYTQLLSRQPFITAVARAREAAWLAAPQSSTWAAYQCYGDPNWTFRPSWADSDPFAVAGANEFDDIASPVDLALALETLAVDRAFGGVQSAQSRERIQILEAGYASMWGEIGAVAETFALAHAAAGDYDRAISWYERALSCSDASASLKAQEQLGSLRARRGWARASNAERGSPAIGAARHEIAEAVRDLELLASLQPTMERFTLCGSAWKRLAMLEYQAADVIAAIAAMAKAADCYGKAEALAAARHDPDLFYPGLNRIGLQLVTHLLQAASGRLRLAWGASNAASNTAVRASLQARTQTDPDFCSYLGLIELDLYEAVAAGRLAAQLGAIDTCYRDLYNRVPSQALWMSEADQAQMLLGVYAKAAKGGERSAAETLLAALRVRAGA